ncbi:MAG: hypothetical protein QXJ96_02265 [Candidatus Aenigmatarchaeota archaeon]|nr:hypothetical protein [Candidatus Aenigmarchaeota archaeon]
MPNGQKGVILDIGALLTQYLQQRATNIEELQKVSTDPTKIVDYIFYGTLEKDPTTNQIRRRGGLLNISDDPSGNPLSGNDIFSPIDPSTMTMSVPIGYLIGVANERMTEADYYGAAIEIGAIKDLSRPLSDFIYAFALTNMLSEEQQTPRPTERRDDRFSFSYPYF